VEYGITLDLPFIGWKLHPCKLFTQLCISLWITRMPVDNYLFFSVANLLLGVFGASFSQKRLSYPQIIYVNL